MREITMFEAEDGKLFHYEEECLIYERRTKLTDEVLDQIKAWNDDFEQIEVSAEYLNWVDLSVYFFAPNKECREALNFIFKSIKYVLPFAGSTEKSVRVKWDENRLEFIDFDVFCEEMETRRKKMY